MEPEELDENELKIEQHSRDYEKDTDNQLGGSVIPYQKTNRDLNKQQYLFNRERNDSISM